MKVGLYLSHMNSYTHTKGVFGEEILVDAYIKGLRKNYPEHTFNKYGDNMGFTPIVDIAIYFSGKAKNKGKQKNIYIQQNYRLENDLQAKIVKQYKDIIRDSNTKVATISGKYAKEHGWYLLEPAVDTDLFYPVKFNQLYNFDVSYIGNNIKDLEKSKQYLGIQGAKVGVFGHGFNNPISHKDSLNIYTSSFINLNYVIRPELDVLICRPYQIAGCKGFIVSEWTESLEKNFGKTIEYVRPGQNPSLRIKEVLAQIKGNTSKAKQQREEAYKIVLDKFNCEIQAEKLWRWINE